MIAAWMVYCIAIGLAMAGAGAAAHRTLLLAGRPTRWAWSAALLATLLLPLAARLRPQAFGSITVPLATPVSSVPNHTNPVPGEPPPRTALTARGFSLADLDGVLGWGWGLSSVALLLGLGGAAARLAVLRKAWRRALVGDCSVLVADDVGPAVAWLWRPQVVVPEWALRLPDALRRLMLVHEEEHVLAKDPWLLAGGVASVVLTPWNPAVWWLLRQLRLAVEMDCDARVLGRGHRMPEYAELLLQVGERNARLPVTAAALGEPRSFLARRIRRLTAPIPRWRWLSGIGALAVAVAAGIVACETPRPVPSELQGRAWVGPTVVTMFPRQRKRTADSILWLVRDPSGTVVARGALRQPPEDTVLDALKLAHRVPGYDTLPLDRVVLDARTGGVSLSLHLRDPRGPSAADLRDMARLDAYAAYIRKVARLYHPNVFAGPAERGAAIALVFDLQDRVVGHAAGVREARDGDCLAVVKRLLPAFAAAQPSQSGCVDAGGPGRSSDVSVYWMKLIRLPASARSG